MRTAYFDSDGKCLIIQTGDMEPPEGSYYSAEVSDMLGPNTVEYDKAKGKIKEKAKPPQPEPKPPKPNLREKLEELEARIAILEGMLNP